MKKPIEDLSKLPKWAQHRISRLESDIKALQTIVQGFSKTKGEKITGRVSVDPYSDLKSFMLPDRAMIRFQLRKDRTGYIDVSLRSTGVLNLNGAEGLVVLPGASNDVNVVAVHWSDMDKIIEEI